jgi:hypothetical protein
LDVEPWGFGRVGGLGDVEAGGFVGVVWRILDVEEDYGW